MKRPEVLPGGRTVVHHVHGTAYGDLLAVIAGLVAEDAHRAPIPASAASSRATSPDSRAQGRQMQASWPAFSSAASHVFCACVIRPCSVLSSRYITPRPTITRSGKPGGLLLESYAWNRSRPRSAAMARTF